MDMAFGLTFPGSLQDESIICNLCKKFEINLRIVEASFSMDAGWAILQIDGQEDEIQRAFSYLGEKGVKVQPIQVNKK